jgi:hypothetical protein
VILCGKITHIFLLVKALYELFFVRSAILRSPHKGAQSAIEGFVEIIALNEQSPPPMTYAYSVITATMTMYNMTCRCIIYDTRHDVIPCVWLCIGGAIWIIILSENVIILKTW